MANDPEVILDVLFEKGLLFFLIKNPSTSGAHKVRIKFNETVHGINGGKIITDLNIFSNLEYLAPEKEIRIFIDTATSYFGRGEPTQLLVQITWLDEVNKEYRRLINHNLGIYVDLGYLNNID